MAKILSEIKNDVLVQLQASTTVGFYTDAILDDWIDKAHQWAAGYKKWPHTEGRASTTFASLASNADGLLEGNYPEGWRADSIRKMRIGGKRVKKQNFEKFLDFIEDFSSDTRRMFSDYGRVYYVNPNIDLSGTVAVWGQYSPATIDSTDDQAETVFSQGAEEANEAIIEEVISYAKKREQKLAEAQAHHQSARAILDELWSRHGDEQFGYHSPDNDGMFERFDAVDGMYYNDKFKRDQF
jgi:hypothetical protein